MISNFLSFVAGRTDELTRDGIKRRSRFKAHKAAFCVDDRKRVCTEALANVRHQLAGAGIGADQVLAEFHGLLRGMNAARHCRHKKHIPRIAAVIVGLRALTFKFPIVGVCTASGMNTGIRLAVSKLRIVDRRLLIKYQDIFGLFQWDPVCIEKARSLYQINS